MLPDQIEMIEKLINFSYMLLKRLVVLASYAGREHSFFGFAKPARYLWRENHAKCAASYLNAVSFPKKTPILHENPTEIINGKRTR